MEYYCSADELANRLGYKRHLYFIWLHMVTCFNAMGNYDKATQIEKKILKGICPRYLCHHVPLRQTLEQAAITLNGLGKPKASGECLSSVNKLGSATESGVYTTYQKQLIRQLLYDQLPDLIRELID